MVWAVSVEFGGHRQSECFLLTAGEPSQPREVTVGRPPAKSDARPDIVVPDKSVSKVHAFLCVEAEGIDGEEHPCRLKITDRSRFGTTVNGQRLPSGGSQELHVGDRIQLAPKVFLLVEERPLEVAVPPAHPQMPELQQVARHAGARIVHAFQDAAITHVLYGTAEPGVWSAVAHGALRGAPLVDLDWLRRVASAGVIVDSLPELPRLDHLDLPGVNFREAPVRVPLPLPAGTAPPGVLRGFNFGYASTWRDPGLAALLAALGGRVVDRPPQQQQQAAPVVVLVDEEAGGSGRHGLAVLEFLVRLLSTDAAALRTALSAAVGPQQAAPPTPPQAITPEPADSDITEAAEELEDSEEMAQRGAQQRGQAESPSTSAPARAQPPAKKPKLEPGAPATHVGQQRDSGAAQPDGWMAIARRPEDAETAAAQQDVPMEQQAPHPEAPRPKRQRTDAGPAAQPGPGSAPSISRQLAATSLSDRARSGSVPSASAPALPPVPHKPEQEDVPWMTQHTQGPGAARRSGIGLTMATKGLPPPPPSAAPGVAAVAVKEESAPQAPAARGGRAGTVRSGKGGKAAGATGAGAEDAFAAAIPTRVKKEEEEVPEVQDASAQVVLEVDLFAPTPDPGPTRCRAGSANSYPRTSGGGGGGGGFDGSGASGWMGGGGSGGDSQAGMGLQRDFKQFRKQGAQMPALVVKPLPVFIVDNFYNADEAEAFMRHEEERETKKRRADELFKSADTGAKRPPRGTKRG